MKEWVTILIICGGSAILVCLILYLIFKFAKCKRTKRLDSYETDISQSNFSAETVSDGYGSRKYTDVKNSAANNSSIGKNLLPPNLEFVSAQFPSVTDKVTSAFTFHED